MDGVVFKDGDIFEHGAQNDHRHHRRRDARGDRHPRIEAEVGVGSRHQDAENDANDDDSSGEFKGRFMSGNVGFLCPAHARSNPFQ